MRGVTDPGSKPVAPHAAEAAGGADAGEKELATVLREIAGELRAVRHALESRR